VLAQLLEPAAEESISDEGAYDAAFAELVAEFRGRLPAQLAAIDAAVARSDWAALREEAHLLKGTAGGFGFTELTRIAGDIEAAAVAGRHSDAVALCATLDEAAGLSSV
jgi:HPt (histidine-containing phosphotransfer) domain-containing protein